MTPAFPTAMNQTEGATLRDYFAAKAMQGFVSRGASNPQSIDIYAEYAYVLADAMLKAREEVKQLKEKEG